MSEMFEIIMIVSFGVSWPMNVIKSYKARTTKEKSLGFLLLTFIGYICGIVSKILAPQFKWYVMFFYILNLIILGIDLILYFVNINIDMRNENK